MVDEVSRLKKSIHRQSRSCKVCRLRKVKVCSADPLIETGIVTYTDYSATASNHVMPAVLMVILPNVSMNLFPMMTCFLLAKPRRYGTSVLKSESFELELIVMVCTTPRPSSPPSIINIFADNIGQRNRNLRRLESFFVSIRSTPLDVVDRIIGDIRTARDGLERQLGSVGPWEGTEGGYTCMKATG